MHNVDGTRDLLLVDGDYFVQLDPKRTVHADIAVAYLGRRSLCGGATLVGSVEMQHDGRWRASVAADPWLEPQGFRLSAWNCENRYDAIVALWQARAGAYIGSLAS